MAYSFIIVVMTMMTMMPVFMIIVVVMIIVVMIFVSVLMITMRMGNTKVMEEVINSVVISCSGINCQSEGRKSPYDKMLQHLLLLIYIPDQSAPLTKRFESAPSLSKNCGAKLVLAAAAAANFADTHRPVLSAFHRLIQEIYTGEIVALATPSPAPEPLASFAGEKYRATSAAHTVPYTAAVGTGCP